MRPLRPPAVAVDCTSQSLPVSLNLTRSRRQTTQNGDFHACRRKTAGFLLYPSVWLPAKISTGHELLVQKLPENVKIKIF